MKVIVEAIAIAYARKKKEKEIVYGMLFTRQKAMERLDNLALTISEHIFKLCVMPDHESILHWRQELSGWRKSLTRYNQSKMSRPNYNAATLKKYLYTEPLGTEQDVETLKKIVEEDYKNKIKLDKNIHKKLEKYVDSYITSILQNNDNWK